MGGTSEPLARLMSRAERYNDALVDIMILHSPAAGWEDPYCAICLGEDGSRLRHPCETRRLAETALSKEYRA